MSQATEIKLFGDCIQRLINGRSLSREEACERMSEVLCDRQPALQQGAFLAALAAKGETEDEIVGVWEAIDRHDTVHVQVEGPLLENCGTGMDALKTFNVSSAAGIVAAACGVKIARHGARAITSCCGTVDVLEACGIDVDCQACQVADSIAASGIGLFNGMSSCIHQGGGLGRILSQIRFGSVLNMAASLASPVRADMAVRGVFNHDMVPLMAGVMRRIGYRRGLVAHGADRVSRLGMDEISVCGPTRILHFDEHGTRETAFCPADAGLPEWPVASIRALGDVDQEAQRFLLVISGAERGACEDFTVVNAAAALTVAGCCADMREGIHRSRQAIHSGRALEKLTHWIQVQNRDVAAGLARLDTRLSRLPPTVATL